MATNDPVKSSTTPVLKKALKILLVIALLCAIALAVAYHYIIAGGLRARQAPTRLETSIAQSLINLSIPNTATYQVSPFGATASDADVSAGRELYQKRCEICHGFDGSGKTAAGSGLFPPPLDLRPLAVTERRRTDGQLFYFIRYGIRNTGMPGWQLPDTQTWQLVAFLRHLPATAAPDSLSVPVKQPLAVANHYVGSAACKSCHAAIYESWRITPMANVVRNPREHPDAILPDLSKSNSLVHFTAAEIAFVYGSRWKQRYFKQVDGDYYPLPAQWDIIHQQWRPYFAKDDWWSPLYPPDNFKRPTSALCDGCHSVNFDIKTRTVTEWNVGCEKCHGPGGLHVAHPGATNIVNPARQNYVAANDACIQCHSQGRPLDNPIEGKYYDWPVGYDVTRELSAFWKLEDHQLGATTFTHFADGTAHKNRMQGNDYVTSQMYTHGVTCATCHDAHGAKNVASLRKPAHELCLDCHGPNSPNGPHAPTLEAHTHHKSESPGSECIACHMPKIAQTIADINVRSHTFRFITPAMSEALQIPNACNLCHADKSTGWATDALKTWTNLSPWRLGK